MRGIAVRAELTEEWKNREVGDSLEYAILTAEISKATFGLTPSEYKELESGRKVITDDNYLDAPEKQKRQINKKNN